MASGFRPDGYYHIEIGRPDPVGPGGTGGSGGSGSGSNGQAVQQMVIYKGQMGYWTTHTTGVKNDHTTNVFIPVGPSEAEKAASAAKALQEKQRAEAAAAAAQKAAAAAAAAAAEKARKDAVKAGALAGQNMSVSAAQTGLNNATAEVTRLNKAVQTAAANATQKRQAANNANTSAVNAENALKGLLNKIRGMTVNKGKYGRWHTRSTGVKNEHTTTTFASSGITVDQVTAARTNATNLRAQANQRAKEATQAEQTSSAAIAARDAETRRQAAAAALLSAKQAAAAAEQKRLADIAAKAAEAARIAAAKEKARQARQAAADKLKSTDIQSVRGIPATAAPAAFPLAWSVASGGGISLGSDVAGAVWSRISAGFAKLRGIMAASMVGPVAVTAAGLLYSRDVGEGSDVVPGRDISTLMPGDVFDLPDTTALNRAADAKTTVSMPVRGRTILRSDGTLETQLVRTPVAGNVPVVRGVLDAATGYWSYKLPAMQGVPGQTILVSPSDAPGVNGPLGLTGPVPLPERIVHTGGQDSVPDGGGTTTTPVFGDLDFRDFILIFPDSALLKPLYVMQNSPYGEATDRGEHSGRPYNPDKAGGPVQNLDWHGAAIDQTGVDKVKLHTGRFESSDANQMMIDRLDKILKGELQVTDTDKRFYTHEIRELERYRALNIKDGTVPDTKKEASEVWNNTHTATLEDFKLKSDDSLFYTPDAIKAAEEQEMRGIK